MPATNLPAEFPTIALFGPTAVGKTSIAIRLAEEIGAEIVNIDSVQLYRKLDIGSAKPTLAERSRVVHHLVDILDPDEPMDAAKFAQLARRAMMHVRGKGKNVILAGGTGLYLDAVLKGVAEAPSANPAIRRFLREVMERHGPSMLRSYLEEVDPKAAAKIHPNDRFRTIRALEVALETGRPISWWWQAHPRPRQSRALLVGLTRSREELYRRIEQRVDDMLEAGFVGEVEELLTQGYSPELKPLRTLGYRHIIKYLSGEWDLDLAVSMLKRDTRRFAKRQLTWFKGYSGARWFHAGRLSEAPSIWTEITGAR